MERRRTMALSCGLVALALLAGIAGCDNRKQGAAGTGASQKGAAAEAEEQRRFNAAVKALNLISSYAFSSGESYAASFDARRGPTGRENGPRVMSIDHRWTQEGLDELRKAFAGRPPKDALDEASGKYAAAVERLVSLTAAASRYYEQEDWREDKYAKGKELHPQLVEAYAGFEAAHTTLSAEVRRVGDARRASRLASLKAGGQIIRHDLEVNLDGALNVLEFVNAQMKKVKRPQDMDLDGLKQRIDAFDSTLAGLRTIGGKGSEQAQKEFGYRASNVDSYLSYADRFLRDAKDVLRAGRARKPMPRVDHPEEFGMTGNYNEMVRTFNGLNPN